ncbi:MAG: DUF2189 domain-containing protein [Bosea sp. (in: a-proteobacteria)]
MSADTQSNGMTAANSTHHVRKIGISDLLASLKSGLSDFAAAPTFGLFFGLFYALGGAALLSLAWSFGQYMLMLPLIMGFALIGPFAAVGLYEVSRRLEEGLPLSFPVVLGVVRRQSTRQIMMLGFALMVLLLFWVRVALLIYALNFGMRPVNPLTMGLDAMFTPAVATFLMTGTLIGAGFAFVAFAISVFSFPHLLANQQDFISAIILSVKGVLLNLPVMLIWGAIVGTLLVLAAAPLFLGLLVVLPILGHATWHLYRRVVV